MDLGCPGLHGQRPRCASLLSSVSTGSDRLADGSSAESTAGDALPRGASPHESVSSVRVLAEDSGQCPRVNGNLLLMPEAIIRGESRRLARIS